MKRPAAKKGRAKKAPARRGVREAPEIQVKRAYDDPDPADGLRFLVDRLWPRGVSKAALKLEGWLRDLAPSNELRQWYGHDPQRFDEFGRRYRDELAAHKAELADLRTTLKTHAATLITATRDLEVSHAVVLRDVLRRRKG
jgi:uncharacterized protein YeaO (DUF488 family)